MVPLLIVCLLVGSAARADDLLAEAAREEAAVLALMHRVVTAALARDRTAVAEAIGAVERMDRDRALAGRRPSGMLDDLRRLAAALEPSPRLRRHALEAALRRGFDPEATLHARHALENDDGARARRLLADDAHNRRANLVNDALRPFGVFTGGALLAAVNPVLLAGSAVDSLATTAVHLWRWNSLTSPQREALVRYRDHLRRDPFATDAAEASRALRRLEARRERSLCDEAREAARRALDTDALPLAAFWLKQAEQTPDCLERARDLRERLARARTAARSAADAARSPAREVRAPSGPQEATAHAELVRALAGGDPRAVLSAARGFLAGHATSDLAPGAHIAAASALDRLRNAAGAREELTAAAKDPGSPGRLAEVLLARLRTSPLAELAAAERAHAAEVVRYVLLGDLDTRSTLYGAAQVGAQGIQGLGSLGLVNLIGVAMRSWRAWRQDPASNEAIIERGEALLARGATGQDAAELHRRLARAYERSGQYQRALMHVRPLPVPDGEWLTRLEEKLAGQLVDEARGSPAERLLLEQIARDFPGTDGAVRAERRLAELPQPGEIPVDRETLRASPELIGPRALDLESGLLDGDPANGELADRGVVVTADGVRLHLAGNGESPGRELVRPLDSQRSRRVLATLAEVIYARRLHAGEPERPRFERWIPIFLRGSIGESGVAVTPGIKLRRYRSDDAALFGP